MEELYKYLNKCFDNEEDVELIVNNPPHFLQGKIQTINKNESIIMNYDNQKIGFLEILGFPQGNL